MATELESGLRRIEQLIRWSGQKAEAITSSSQWPAWCEAVGGAPEVSRLLIVRWTRANRVAAGDARRLLREAYPADPRDALDAIGGGAAWPGPALLWARIDAGAPRLVAT